MKKIFELKDLLCEELDRLTTEVAKGKMSTPQLELIHKLTDTIKNVDKIMVLENEGYSGAGNWEANINGEYGHPSMARGRGRRNSNSLYGENSHRYSRDEAKEEMVEKLEDMMFDAEDAKTKETIRKCMEMLKRG